MEKLFYFRVHSGSADNNFLEASSKGINQLLANLSVYLAVEKRDAQRPFHAFLADDGLDYIFIDLLDDKRYCDNQVGFDLFESFHYDFWGGNFAKQSYVRANCRSGQKVESTSVSMGKWEEREHFITFF